MSENEASKPFFSRKSSDNAISTLGRCQNLTIYCGAGVTIDSTAVSWSKLVDELLKNLLKAEPADLLESIEEDFSELQSASIAIQLFKKAYGDEQYRDRLTDLLRVILYNNEGWRKGRLATNIARLVILKNLNQQLNGASALSGSCVVTPNYDAYLYEEIQSLISSEKWRLKQSGSATVAEPSFMQALAFPTAIDPLFSGTQTAVELSSWVGAEEIFPLPTTVACVHLHGYLPIKHSTSIDSDNGDYRNPVVCEQDYFDTSSYSYDALYKLFSQSSVLIVGASMTDAPLLRALADTADIANDNNFKRMALVALQGDYSFKERKLREKLMTNRYSHFKVEPVFLDYYGQIPQFIEEVMVASGDPILSDDSISDSYSQRLQAWWDEWFRLIDGERYLNQNNFHITLALAVSAVRDLLGIVDNEEIKIELWSRWDPAHERVLALWATSLGTVSDIELIRKAKLTASSDYACVQAWTAGRPIISKSLKSADPNGRWHTYIGIPLFLDVNCPSIHYGAITIASTSDSDESALNPSTNQARLTKVIEYVTDLGLILLTPDLSLWEEYYEIQAQAFEDIVVEEV